MNRLNDLINFLDVGAENDLGVHLSQKQADEIKNYLVSFESGIEEVKNEIVYAEGWNVKDDRYISGLRFAKECFE